MSNANTVSMASFIYASQFYPKSNAPEYLMEIIVNIVFVAAVIVLAQVMRVWSQVKIRQMKRENTDVRLLYAY